MQLICGVKESKKQFYFHFLNYLTNDLKLKKNCVRIKKFNI